MVGLEKGDRDSEKREGEDVENICRSGPHPGCILESPGEPKKLLMPRPTLKDSAPMGMGVQCVCDAGGVLMRGLARTRAAWTTSRDNSNAHPFIEQPLRASHWAACFTQMISSDHLRRTVRALVSPFIDME